MSALNRPDNFAGRVNYAAAVICRRGEPTRSFDNCFENHDGDAVAVALWRRAQKNPVLAANMPRYVSMSLVEQNARDHAEVPTRKLAELAAAMRAKAKASSDAAMARREQEKAESQQRCAEAGYSVEPSTAPNRWTAKRPDGSVIDADCYWEDNAWYMAACDLKCATESAATADV